MPSRAEVAEDAGRVVDEPEDRSACSAGRGSGRSRRPTPWPGAAALVLVGDGHAGARPSPAARCSASSSAKAVTVTGCCDRRRAAALERARRRGSRRRCSCRAASVSAYCPAASVRAWVTTLRRRGSAEAAGRRPGSPRIATSAPADRGCRRPSPCPRACPVARHWISLRASMIDGHRAVADDEVAGEGEAVARVAQRPRGRSSAARMPPISASDDLGAEQRHGDARGREGRGAGRVVDVAVRHAVGVLVAARRRRSCTGSARVAGQRVVDQRLAEAVARLEELDLPGAVQEVAEEDRRSGAAPMFCDRRARRGPSSCPARGCSRSAPRPAGPCRRPRRERRSRSRRGRSSGSGSRADRRRRWRAAPPAWPSLPSFRMVSAV